MMPATKAQGSGGGPATAAMPDASGSSDHHPVAGNYDITVKENKVMDSVTTADDDARIALEYVSDTSDEEQESKPTPRLTLEQQAKLEGHLLTHKPYNAACNICIAAKARRRQHRRRLQPVHRSLTKFGQIVTCDHIDLASWWQHSHKGHMCALIMYDLSTGFLGSYPSYTKTGSETWENVKRFQGSAQTSYIYSDGSAEIDAACKHAGIVHDCSQAGDPQNNAVAERQVQESVQGTTCNLLQAGLPHQFWPWAMRYHAAAANFTKDKRGTSPWQRKFDEDFEAKIIPFGARILFIPNKTTKLWKINSSFTNKQSKAYS